MNLLLFFTYGISLKIWDETGLLEREIVLYKKLIDNDVKVTFVTYGDESDYSYKHKLGAIDVIPFYAFVKRRSNNIIGFVQSLLLPLILKNQLRKADILKTNQMSMTWAPLLAKLLFKKPLIVRCGFEWYRFLLLKGNTPYFTRARVFLTEWLFYKIADRIILTSKADRKYVERKFGINTEKTLVINNYVDVDLYKPSGNHHKKKKHILFIGRLVKQKNLFALLDAISETEYTLDIVGAGELKNDLKSYIEDKEIRVNFLGLFPNIQMPEIMNNYETFVLPSFWEGCPKALLEAMSCGLAVVGTDVEGINTVIRHKENGYLCQTDSLSIRDAINTLMHDEALRFRIGNLARKYIVENYNLAETVNMEREIYDKISSTKAIFQS